MEGFFLEQSMLILNINIFHNIYYAINDCNSSAIMSPLSSVKMSLCIYTDFSTRAEQVRQIIDNSYTKYFKLN